MSGFIELTKFNRDTVLIDVAAIVAVSYLYNVDKTLITGCRIHLNNELIDVIEPPYIIMDLVGSQKRNKDSFNLMSWQPATKELETILRDSSLANNERRQAIDTYCKGLGISDNPENSV